jgi:hypothetical protein
MFYLANKNSDTYYLLFHEQLKYVPTMKSVYEN